MPESEAELLALDCWLWWSTVGEFGRRGCGGAVLCRGERRGEHGRARERAGVSGEERSDFGR